MKRLVLCLVIFSVTAFMAIAGGSQEAAPAGADKSLTCWTWKLAFMPGLEAAAKAYEAKTGIKVTFQAFTPDQTYKQKANAASATNSLPDLVHWWAATNMEFIDQLVDMRTQLDDSWKKQFYPVSWPPVTVSQAEVDDWQKKADVSPVFKELTVGHISGIPLDVGAFFMFYGNKKVLQEGGVSLDPRQT